MNTKDSKRTRRAVNAQAGLISLMVTLLITMVISLIVLGFAQVTRHNQRQSLDSQLSTQAYYAAESGVNDAVAKLKTITTPLTLADQTNCTSFMTGQGLSGQLNAANNVTYTCLLVNNTPPILQYAKVANGRALAIPLIASTNVSDLNFTWDAADTTNLTSSDCSAGNDLPQNVTTGWNCSFGLLRLDLVPGAGITSATTAANRTLTYYFKPSSTGAGTAAITDFTSATKAYLVNTVCTLAGKCTAALTLSGGASTSLYYARISAVYRDLANITITAQSGVTFQGSQAIIDATGKAQDVLRRIQVHVPLISDTTQAAAAIQTSGSICKLITVINGFAQSGCSVISGGPAASVAGP